MSMWLQDCWLAHKQDTETGQLDLYVCERQTQDLTRTSQLICTTLQQIELLLREQTHSQAWQKQECVNARAKQLF